MGTGQGAERAFLLSKIVTQKYGPRTSSNGFTWELIRNAESRALPGLAVQVCILNEDMASGGALYAH